MKEWNASRPGACHGPDALQVRVLTPGRRGASPPSPAVAGKQDPRYTRADFLRDLERVSRRVSEPSSPRAPGGDRRSPSDLTPSGGPTPGSRRSR
jgi:hypothetical protein